MVVITVTPLIAKVDSADLAGQAGVPCLSPHFLHTPHTPAYFVKEYDHPDRGGPYKYVLRRNVSHSVCRRNKTLEAKQPSQD